MHFWGQSNLGQGHVSADRRNTKSDQFPRTPFPPPCDSMPLLQLQWFVQCVSTYRFLPAPPLRKYGFRTLNFSLDSHEISADLPQLFAPRLVHGFVGNDVFPCGSFRVLSVPTPVCPGSGKLVRGYHISNPSASLLSRQIRKDREGWRQESQGRECSGVDMSTGYFDVSSDDERLPTARAVTTKT